MTTPSLDSSTDALLVARVQAGDERAFAVLYRRHVRYVAAVVQRLLRHDAEVDDVLQQAFAKAYAHADELRDPAGFRAWVVRIAAREALDTLDRRRRASRLARAVEGVAPAVSDPADRARVEALACALEQLPPKLQLPWVLHEIGGETLPEVARICDLGLSTVKRRLAEASTLIDRRLHGR
jgi:RNA polymerase sigma-70 factor (ECF subfamily)